MIIINKSKLTADQHTFFIPVQNNINAVLDRILETNNVKYSSRMVLPAIGNNNAVTKACKQTAQQFSEITGDQIPFYAMMQFTTNITPDYAFEIIKAALNDPDIKEYLDTFHPIYRKDNHVIN